MQIDSGWVAALASVVSALVITVTAIAAFVQIRHARNANEITVYLRLVDRIDSLEAGETFARLDTFVESVRTDPAVRARLMQRGISDEFRDVASLIQFLEHLSTLLVTGGITETLVLAEYADNIEQFWDRIAETIYLRRAVLGPYYGVTFEHLAMRAKQYIAEGGMERLYGRLKKDPRMRSFAPSTNAGESPITA
jgi:hypothetical protein